MLVTCTLASAPKERNKSAQGRATRRFSRVAPPWVWESPPDDALQGQNKSAQLAIGGVDKGDASKVE